MKCKAYFFSEKSINAFLGLFCVSIVIAIIALIVISKGLKKDKNDLPLRIIVIQMSIAAIILNVARIILFIVFSKLWKGDLISCKILEQIIEPLTATIPFLFSSYFITLYNLLFDFSSKKISIIHLMIILAIVNWVIPIIYWVFAVWVVDDPFEDINIACNYCNNVIIIIHKVCGLVMSFVGLIFGFLIRKHYFKKDMNTETNCTTRIYLGISISYFLWFLFELIFLIIDSESNSWRNFMTFYRVFNNIVFVFLPNIFFMVFCFSYKRKKESAFTKTPIRFDNSSIICQELGTQCRTTNLETISEKDTFSE